jgi:hypothetical protein
MKQRTRIILVVIVAATVGLVKIWLWPAIALDWAKIQAKNKLAGEEAFFNIAPEAAKLQIVASNLSGESVSFETGDYRFSLPAREFSQDALKKGSFQNDRYSLFIFGTVDTAEAYAPLMQLLHETNAFELIDKAYSATLLGIQNQPDREALRKHLALLNLKATILPRGGEHYFKRFDRGEFKGFILGDPSKDAKVVLDIFSADGKQNVSVLVRKKNTLELSDVSEVLSILSVSRLPKPELVAPK